MSASWKRTRHGQFGTSPLASSASQQSALNALPNPPEPLQKAAPHGRSGQGTVAPGARSGLYAPRVTFQERLKFNGERRRYHTNRGEQCCRRRAMVLSSTCDATARGWRRSCLWSADRA